MFETDDEAASADRHLLRTLLEQNETANLNENHQHQHLLLANLDLLASDEFYFLNSIRHLAQPVQMYLVKSALRLSELRQVLASQWLNENAYQVVYGQLNSNSTIEWTEVPLKHTLRCTFMQLQQVFNQTLSLYAKLNVNILSFFLLFF